LLQRNKKAGTTLVLVTHDPEVASRADRKIVLKDGLVVEDTMPFTAADPAAEGSGAPCMTAPSAVKQKLRAASRCGRDGVKGAVLWRSSRPLTPSRPLPPLAWVRISDVLSEIRTIAGNVFHR
jgi:energy-coupling factor transporter ATP-binding protein EcfA2